jgi:dihydropteroate synthase
MGIVNVTPDSFSDGGLCADVASAVDHARAMVASGATILDVGAESTKPGAARVSAADQISRLADILPALCELGVAVSIDTTRAEVAEFALDCGATMINDISAGRDDPAMFDLAASRGAELVLMHMQGEPASMQANPQYDDVVAEVAAFLAERMAAAIAAGVAANHIILDPGIGFGKTTSDNLALLQQVDAILALDTRVLIGPSRKRFIDDLSGAPTPTDRIGGTIAACLETYRQGATLFRVHDVRDVHQALTVACAMAN